MLFSAISCRVIVGTDPLPVVEEMETEDDIVLFSAVVLRNSRGIVDTRTIYDTEASIRH